MQLKHLIFVLFASIHTAAPAGAEPAAPCSEPWYRYVEKELVSSDGQGHGPDLGSDEWKGVVEFKLGIRGQADLPDRASDDWCRLIDHLLHER
jgi:hypothetical protein